MENFLILKTIPSRSYSLLDSGDSEKLERYENVTLSRPDPQALWKKQLPESEWKKAKARFSRDDEKISLPKLSSGVSGWKIEQGVPDRWQIELEGLKFWIKPTAFKHTGIFPEQVSNWMWIKEIIEHAKKEGREKISVLNLFGYTGGATLAAAQAGADVVHLDGSKAAVTWAKENAEISGLSEKPIRWIVDDARMFVKREIKRGNKYEAIIMDPPAFGHGPQGEVWKIEENFLELLDLCKQILSPQPLFFLINGYASGYSALAYKNNLVDLMKMWKGTIEIGELTIEEAVSKRLLPAGIFSRWKAE